MSPASEISAVTQKIYSRHMRAFAQYCERRGETSLPAEPGILANYVTELANVGRSAVHLRQIVAGIVSVHHRSGCGLDSKHPLIVAAISGGRPPRRRAQRPWVVPLEELAKAPRDLMICTLLGDCGMLASEVVGLDWQTVGAGSGYLCVRERGVEIQYLKWRAAAEPIPRRLSFARGAPFDIAARQWATVLRPPLGAAVFVSVAHLNPGERLSENGIRHIGRRYRNQ